MGNDVLAQAEPTVFTDRQQTSPYVHRRMQRDPLRHAFGTGRVEPARRRPSMRGRKGSRSARISGMQEALMALSTSATDCASGVGKHSAHSHTVMGSAGFGCGYGENTCTGGRQGLPVMRSHRTVKALRPCLRAVSM